MTYCKCTFASSQVCKFTKEKKSLKVQINNYNLQIASSQVCNSTSLQVYKITKSRN